MNSVPEIYLSRGRAGCDLAVRLGAVAIVVDALRASAAIALLLTQGIGRVAVVARVDDARALAAAHPDAVLVGERGSERIPGFQLGNSPLEILSSPRMEGSEAIFTSSNGARRLVACAGAAAVCVGTLSTAGVVAPWARAIAESRRIPVVLIAAGKYPDEAFHSPEDEASCAYLAMRIGLPIAGDSREPFARWERDIARKGLEAIFRDSRHARRLMEIGYGEDVLFCARPDTVAALPIVCEPVPLWSRRVGVSVMDARYGPCGTGNGKESGT